MSEKENPKGPEEIGMMGRLLATRTVLVSGPVDAEMAAKVIQQLLILEAEDPKKAITLMVNSPGGEVFSGFAIFDTLRFITPPVVTLVIGLAASMGSIIPLAAPKGSRYCLPNSKFLIHQPLLMGYQGRATDLEIQAKEILKDRERIVQLYAEVTGKKADTIAKDIDHDKWMTPEEAKAYNLVDHIITGRSELSTGR